MTELSHAKVAGSIRNGPGQTHGAGGAKTSSDLHDPAEGRSLSALDAAFLYLERKEIPLSIASVCVFDGPVPFERFVASIESKLDLVPRWRQVVVMPSLNAALPSWQPDPNFDIRRHIVRVRLERPGGQSELEAFAGRLLSQTMDRSKPLWDIHVVDGLQGRRGAIIWRLHHALADGVSGAGLLQKMLDPTPRHSRGRYEGDSRAHRPRSSHSRQGPIDKAVASVVKTWITAEKGVLGLTGALFTEQMQEGLKHLAGLLPEVAVAVERLPFNRPCGAERKFSCAEIDLIKVLAIHQKVGVTVNDVVLTVLTRALARYVKAHGESAVNRFVRIVCPVSLRNGNGHHNGAQQAHHDEGHGGELGNQISFLPVALPMGIRNPVRMLESVAMRTRTMKQAGAAGLVGLAAACIAAAPAPLQALFWWALPEVILPVPLFNMICTNVPGSATPLYAVGRRMLAAYPQVPTGYDLGVGCAVQSYDGKLCFGLIADAVAAPDVDRLRDFLYVSFDELWQAAGIDFKRSKRTGRSSQRREPPAGFRVKSGVRNESR